MELATPSRVPLQDTSVMDKLLLEQATSTNYFTECKLPVKKTSRREPTPEPMEGINEDGDSCLVWEPQNCKEEKRKFKLIQFHKNYRPAYYGTWSKPRGKVCARNPFRKDTVSFFVFFFHKFFLNLLLLIRCIISLSLFGCLLVVVSQWQSTCALSKGS